MLGLGKKSRQLVGLDIGSSSIKALELRSTKAGYELVSFGMENLAPDTVVDGAIMDAPPVANAIRKIFDWQRITTKNLWPSSSRYSAIGRSVMNMNIVRGGVPLFTRDVSVGGNQYTDALQKELDLSFEDAERLKKGDTLPSVTDEQKQQILRSVSDILTLEIQKTFDFFRATASGENIQRIVVAGGTARVPGLVDLLREEFAMPVEELNPFRKVQIDPGKHSDDQIREMAPRLAIAVGLALRSFD